MESLLGGRTLYVRIIRSYADNQSEIRREVALKSDILGATFPDNPKDGNDGS